MAGSERQTWMVEQMDVGADDRVLELGHGHGVAASAICAVLAQGTGRYVGVDRSATTTAGAARRRLLPPLGFEVTDVRHGSPDGRPTAVVTARHR